MGKLRKNKGKITRFSLALLTALTVTIVPTVDFGTTAAAVDYDAIIAELEEKAEKLEQENAQREQEIDGLQGDIAENDYAMSLINDQIAGYNAEIDNLGDQITAMQQRIADKHYEIKLVEEEIENKEEEIELKRAAIKELEAENKENLRKFAKLCRALYMNDTTDTVPILDGSDDWYDFFVYVDVVQNISEQNMDFMNRLLSDIHHQEDLIKGLNDDIAQLNDDKAALKDKIKLLEQEAADLEKKKEEVQATSDERYNKLAEYASYNESLEWQIYSLRSDVDDYKQQIEEINEAIEDAIQAKQAELAGSYDYSSDGFRWPLDTKYQHFTTYFGYDAWRGGNHYGIDIGNAGIGGANIYAAQSGTVITAYNDSGWHGGYGNYVIIDHGGGLSTLYAHCYSTTVTEGQWVNKGEVIGYVGTTGWSTGNHLHFETRVNGVARDPMGYSYEYI